MAAQREAFFLGAGAERRFCLVTRPEGTPRGALLHVPAFGEELNRSRRMVALATQRLAQEGWLVMQIDLHGCGDSEGDFGDTSWSEWLRDIDRAHQWLLSQTQSPIALWSLRTGSLLASQWLSLSSSPKLPLLAWQPVLSGKQYLTQFLRIKLGADLADSNQARGLLSKIRETLQAGERVMVGGYLLQPALVEGMEASNFAFSPGHPATLAILEVAAGERVELTPATDTWTEKARAQGMLCEARAISGPKFWQSAEIEVAPALVPASLIALEAILT